MKSIQKYKNRQQRKGGTIKERVLNEGIHQFKVHLRNSPTAHSLQVTDVDEVEVTEKTKTIKCFITNVTLNDQRTMDEKYIHFELDANVDIGCYVKWQGLDWLIVFREHNSANTHKTFIMKMCNQIFKYMYNDKIYNIPIVTTNLTLYSDGMADGIYTSRPDAKRNVTMGDNPITRLVELGTRIMLTNLTVFRVTHIDDFSHNGIKTMIIYQTTLIPEDNLKDNVAYNPPHLSPSYKGQLLQCDDVIYLGEDLEITINEEYEGEVEWSCISKNTSGALIYKDGKKAILRAISDSRHIGQEIVVDVYDLDNYEVLDTKIITVKGFF